MDEGGRGWLLCLLPPAAHRLNACLNATLHPSCPAHYRYFLNTSISIIVANMYLPHARGEWARHSLILCDPLSRSDLHPQMMITAALANTWMGNFLLLGIYSDLTPGRLRVELPLYI